jgi:hypothetical protein
MSALPAEPAPAEQLACEHHGRDRVPCGSTDFLARLFIGWRCREHTLAGAQVYELAPLPDGPLTGPGLVVEHDGSLRAPGTGRRDVPPPSRLPDPARPGAAVQLDQHGAAEQAAALVWGRTGKPRRRLLDRFIVVGDEGMTSWEAWTWYRGAHGPIDLYTLRPRLTELKKDGWIRDSGRRRHPRGHGDPAAPAEEVLVLTERGQRQAQGGAR